MFGVSSPISSNKMVPSCACSDTTRLGSGERAALVAEKLALEQRLRDRGAVDGDERFTHAFAVLVESARDQLLTRTGFPVNEHTDRLSRDASNVFVEVLHNAAITDDGGTRRDWRAHFHGFGCQSASRGSFIDELEQLLNIEGFNHVIISPAFGCFYGCLGCAVRGHDNQRQQGFCSVELRHKFQTVQARQLEIRQHDVEMITPRPFESFVPSRESGYIIAATNETRVRLLAIAVSSSMSRIFWASLISDRGQ